MFQRLVIRYGDSPYRPFDAGLLGESLVFYDRVSLVAGVPDFQDMLIAIGFDALVALLRSDLLTIYFMPESPLCATYRNGNGELEFDFNYLKHHLPVATGTLKEPAAILSHLVKTSFPDRRVDASLLEKIRLLRLEDVLPGGAIQFCNGLKDLFVNTNVATECCRRIVARFPPPIPTPEVFHYRFARGEYGVVGRSSIEGTFAAELPPRLGPYRFSWMPGAFATVVLDAHVDLALGGRFESGLVGADLGADLFGVITNGVLGRREKEERDLKSFQELILDDGRQIRECIRSGERSLLDLLPLLEKKEPFTKWLGSLTPDASLIHEFMKGRTRGSWMESLPAKVVRFSVFTGMGLAVEPLTSTLGVPGLATAAGIGVGFFDSFILDRLRGGWRPNVFIEDMLLPFARLQSRSDGHA